MTIMEIIGGVLLILVSIIVIVAVAAQETKGGGLGAIGGDSGSGSFFDRNRGKTKEAMLIRATTISGTALAVLTLIILFMTKA